MSTTNPDVTKICMTNLERLNVELNEKEYFSDWQRIYAMILEEHDLNPYEYYESANDRAAMLECVYDVFQKLSNNIDLFRKVETEFASTTAAYQYLQLRLKDIREEIDRAKHTSGTADSIVSYMFFIIDQTLDEVNRMFIHELRIFGGEPTLVPELIDYLVDAIIDRKTIIHNAVMFTNGNVMDESIALSFAKLLRYINSIEQDNLKYIRYFERNYAPVYEHRKHSKAVIVVSTIARDTERVSVAHDVKSYYEQLVPDDGFEVIIQNESFLSGGDTIFIEGNVLDHYKDVIPNPISSSLIRTVENDYYFISENDSNAELPNTTFINKTILISANGNVYPGCSTSYKRVDQNPMFNIMDCHKTLISKIKQWCWQHPVSVYQKKLREKNHAFHFCRDYNISIIDAVTGKPLQDDTIAMHDTCENFINVMETFNKQLHEFYPLATFDEIEAISVGLMCNALRKQNCDKDSITKHMLLCANYRSDATTLILEHPNWVGSQIDRYYQKYNVPRNMFTALSDLCVMNL